MRLSGDERFGLIVAEVRKRRRSRGLLVGIRKRSQNG